MRDEKYNEECFQIGIEIFELIKNKHSRFEMEIETNSPHVEINMDIKKQRGLLFDINLNLQNIDELHIVSGQLWMCWFPCDVADKREDFIDVVSGLISGKYRILETVKNQKVVKAVLQKPINESWVSMSTGLMTFNWPNFGKKSYNVVQN